MKCLRGCGAQMWYQDLRAHLLSCPCRLLVCGSVSDEFEADVIMAGQNGRSADDLRELVMDYGTDSDDDDSSGSDDGGSHHGATGGTHGGSSDGGSDSSDSDAARPSRTAKPAAGAGHGAASSSPTKAGSTAIVPLRRRPRGLTGNAKQPDPLAQEEERLLVSQMSIEEKFLYRVGNERKRAKDKAIGNVPSHSLTLCFKVSSRPGVAGMVAGLSR